MTAYHGFLAAEEMAKAERDEKGEGEEAIESNVRTVNEADKERGEKKINMMINIESKVFI